MRDKQIAIGNELNWCLQELEEYWGQSLPMNQACLLEGLDAPDFLALISEAGWAVIKYQDFNLIHHPRIVQSIDGAYQLLHARNEEWVEISALGLARTRLAYPAFLDQSKMSSWLVFPLSVQGASQSLSQQILRNLLSQCKQLPIYAIAAGIAIFAYEFLALLEPVLLNLAILHVDLFASIRDLLVVLISMGMVMALGLILGYFRQKLWVWFFGRQSLVFSRDLLIQLLYLRLADLKSSDIYTRFFNLEQMVYRFLQQICFSALDLLFLLLHWLGMLYFDWRLALMDSLFVTVFVVLSLISTKAYYLKSKQAIELQHQYSGVLLDSLNHLAFIQRSILQKPIFNRCFQPKRKYWQAFLKAEWMQHRFEWILLLVRKFNLLALIAFGLFFIMKHQSTVGGMMAFWILKMQLSSRLDVLMKRILQFQYLKAPLDKLAELFQLECKKPVIKNDKVTQNDKVGIRLNQPKIRDISYPNIYLQLGKHYWLKGVSGSGKTTLLLGLAGILPLTNGAIDYQGMKRQDLVFVMQTDRLFKASLAENITLFAEHVDASRLEDVINRLGLEDILEHLNQGYATMIGPDGYQLSAGQIQRVLIARALYQQPKWLILDEATCHLDLAAEAFIIRALMQLPLSLIMVNHREEYAHLFDEEIVLGE